MTKADTSIASDAIKKDRRRLLSAAAMGIAAAGAASVLANVFLA
jgi:hypothetical protein